ncbi:replication initiation protein [Brevibacillus halotolerans]|uniref:replication initiation protein n=1 Tax=Brevibacillus halotolerans TaxID=1507437 RepID=UPI001FEA6DEF|nr:replication initiation protein [Brevibacillus halotolerans]
MNASVSIDKFVMEYKDVPLGAYYGLMRDAAMNGFQTKPTIYWGDYCYELHIRKGKEAYLHVFYKNFRETDGHLHTLRLETHPEHYLHFHELLEPMRKVASRITFVGCDVAYDVRTSLGNVIVIPTDMRREMTHEGTTRYFGKAHQRKTNGYCRIYDKRLELWEKQKIMLDHELSRIEIVYKPDQKILLSDVGRYPPEQNDKYFAAVVTDWDVFPRKRVEQIRNMRDGAEMYTQRIRKGVKETLAHPYHVDFNRLAREQWVSLVEVPCTALLGAA